MSTEPTAAGRSNPMLWTEDEAPAGVFVGPAEDGLSLLGLPQGSAARRRAHEREQVASASPHARRKLEVLVDALQAGARGERPAPVALSDLSGEDLALVLDLLGDGEVSALIAEPDGGTVQATESVFAGLWVLRRESAPEEPWAEVGDCPALVREMAAAVERTTLPLEHMVPPDGAMNVMGVLTEVRHRAQAWTPGDPNHVMNFTLLPMTEADAEFLAAVLGQGPVRFASGGYGSARVIATGLKHVWAVQYLNSMGAVILDTLEIGDAPSAALACVEDFEDSARRLAHILKGALQ
jgi:hydrogenase-1 operon protein HyaF